MKRIVALLLALVMIVTAMPSYPASTVEASESTGSTGSTGETTQRVLFNEDFDGEEYSREAYGNWLAKEIFGEGNYTFGQGTRNATMYMENGALRIIGDNYTAPTDGRTQITKSQFLLSNDASISEKGVVIELDYTLNEGSNGYFAFASKPLVEGAAYIDSNDIWISGIWPNGYRTTFRNKQTGNVWNKPGYATTSNAYSTASTTYKMKLEALPNNTIKLSVKTPTATSYTTLHNLALGKKTSNVEVTTALFEQCFDDNLRMLVASNCDVTLDNMKVYLADQASVAGDERTYLINNDFASYPTYEEWLATQIFGEGNYQFGQGTQDATLKIENGALRIIGDNYTVPTDGRTQITKSQFLLSDDPSISEKGVVIELDYTLNEGSNGYFAFASKPVVSGAKYIDSNDIWISGIWPDGYRTTFRNNQTGNVWNKPGYATTSNAYSTASTTYKMKLEALPNETIKLSVKTPTATDYTTLHNLALGKKTNNVEVTSALFEQCFDDNLRLLVASNCDVSIDNLKVTLLGTSTDDNTGDNTGGGSTGGDNTGGDNTGGGNTGGDAVLPEGVFFDNNFDAESLSNLQNDALAKALFGQGNYLLGKDGNDATLSIVNGALRIKGGTALRSQYLLASDDEIAEKGAVIECDYTVNSGSNDYFAFAGKPISEKKADSNDLWISGIWKTGYRASLRGTATNNTWVKPGIANTSDATYSAVGTTFHLQVEATPEDGIKLSVKKPTEDTYKTLAHLTLADMAQYPNVNFADFRDGNVRLIVGSGCDVTIENLKVSIPEEDMIEIPKKELPAGVYFDDDFNIAEYAQLKDDDLAEAVFGTGNYLLGKSGNNASVSIENGGLRIKSSSSVASQYLLATDDAIKGRGVIIECDYVFNAGSAGQLSFASKPIERGNLIDSNDVWISGIWANGYRASLRGEGNKYLWEKPGLANTKDSTYSTTGTAYKLRIEVTPDGGIKLFAKKASDTNYTALLLLSTDKMALVPEVSFTDYRDGNVRLIIARNCDVTIDNLKVVLGPEAKKEVVVEKQPLADGVLFYDDFSNSGYSNLSNSDLAKVIFGEGNYLFGQGSVPATISIQNGALRIVGDDNGTPTNGETKMNRTQFLLASDERIAKQGVVIECDYKFNALKNGEKSAAMLFASKPVATRNFQADAWLAGPYANDKSRTAVRYAPDQAWKPLAYGGNVETSGLLNVNYKLRLEVSPSGGLALYVKRDGMDDYIRMGKWTAEDIALFRGDYSECLDKNIRLMIQCNMDVTIDNLKVTLMNYTSKMQVSNKEMYFYDDFNNSEYADLTNDSLAEAIFGKYNFLLGHGTQDATLKIENGALHLVGDNNTAPTDGTANIHRSQFLLASHPNIEKEGVIIECDYIFNAGATNAFTFASKGLVTSTDPKKTPSGIEANIWVAGPYANAKSRTAVRYLPKYAWSPLATGASEDMSGKIEVRYHLKLEVSPTEGLALYAKTSMKGEYKRLGTWSEEDIRLFANDYKGCMDENVRLILQTGCDVTIDNLAVYAPGSDYVATEETVKVKVNGEEKELSLGDCDLSTLVDGEFLFAVVNGRVIMNPIVAISHETKTIDIYSLSIHTLDGVSVRTDKKGALRWLTTVNQVEYATLEDAVKKGVIKEFEIGTIMMKTADLNNSGVLDIEQEENGAIIQTFEGEWISSDAYEGMYLYSGVMDDIEKDDYNTRFCGVGYAKITLKNGKKLYVYGDFDRYVHSRTISEVSATALSDEANGLSKKQQQSIKKFAKAYKGKDAIDGAIVDIVLVENGVTNYTITVSKDASDIERNYANQIRTEIASKTGVGPKIITDTRYKEEAYEIVIGNARYAESQELNHNLDANEYSIRIVGNKIIISGVAEATLESAVKMFGDLLKDDSAKEEKNQSKNLTVSFADETRDEMSNWLVNIPEFKGGTYESMYECGNDSIQFYYTSVDASRIDEYVKKLQTSGYELKQDNTIGNNRYVTCVGEQGMVHLTYLNYFETMTIVTDPLVNEIYKGEEPEYEKITDTTLAVMSLDYSHREIKDGNGECYIITLEDGRYVIIDGGYTNDADGLYNFLVDNNKRKDGKIVVAAWIISHSHADHYGAFSEFTSKYASNITLEYIVAAPGSERMYTNNGFDSWLTKNLPPILKQYDAQHIRPHAGQILKFCDVEFQMLYTVESYAPNLITGENNASLIFRMTSEGQTVLFNNDAEFRIAEWMANTYGEALKSDMMQVNHHGRSGSYDLYFSYVKPQYTLWTTNHITFDLRTAEVFNSSLDNEVTLAGNRYLYKLVGRENCFIADGDVEIITFPLKNKATDITYYTVDHEARK